MDLNNIRVIIIIDIYKAILAIPLLKDLRIRLRSVDYRRCKNKEYKHY